jgi:predicted transcriptional regulator
MNKKRSRLQVIHDILKTINAKNGRIKPTHILYKSNLSHKMMAGYLKELKEKGLITEEQKGRSKTYFVTTKGTNYLSEYRTMSNFIGSFGLDE